MKRQSKRCLLLSTLLVIGLVSCQTVTPSSSSSSSTSSSNSSGLVSSSTSSSSSVSSSSTSTASSSTSSASSTSSSTTSSTAPSTSTVSSSSSTSSATSSSSSTTPSSSSSTIIDVKVPHSVVLAAEAGSELHLDKISAVEGETVSFTVEVTNTKKELASVKVVSGEVELEVSENDGTYSFVMPDAEVTVSTVLADKIIPYALHVNKDDHVASVTLKVEGEEVTEAVAGQTVVVELGFEEKYMLLDVFANNGAVALTAISEGLSYSFVMPEGEVTLDVTSEKVLETFKVSEVKLASSLVKSVTGVASGAEVVEGTTVNVTVVMAAQTSYDCGAAIYVNDEMIKLSASESDAYTYSGSFVMPSCDVTVVASPLMNQVAADDPNGVKVTFEESEYYKVYGIENGGYYYKGKDGEYTYPQACFSIYKERGVALNSVKVQKGTSYPTTLSTSYIYPDVYGVPLYNYSGGDEVKLVVNVEYVGIKTISFINSEHVTVEGDLEFAPGDKSVAYTLTAESGYIINGITSVEKESGGTIGTSSWETEYYTFSNNKITFSQMPKDNIIVTLDVVKAIPVEVEENEFVESYSLYLNNTSYWGSDIPTTSALPGRTLIIVPTAKDGYAIKNVLVNGQKATLSSGKYKFEVSADSTETSFKVTFEIQQYHSVTVEEGEGYTVSKLYTTSALEGTSISFDVKANPGYSISAVKVSSQDEALVASGSYNCSYSFAMPDADAKISIEVVSVETYKLVVDLDEAGTTGQYTVTDKYGDAVTDLSKLNKGEEYSIAINLKNGYSISSAKLGDTDVTFELTSSWNFGYTAKVTLLADSTLKVVTAEATHNTLAVNLSNAELFEEDSEIRDTTAAEKITDLSKCYAGHKISVNVKLTSDAQKTYQLTSSCYKVTDANGNDISFNVKSNGAIEFVMPETDVTVTVTPAPIPLYQVTLGDGCENVILLVNYNGWGYPTSLEDYDVITENTSLKAGVTVTAYLKNDDSVDGSKTYNFKVVGADGTVIKDSNFSYKGDFWKFEVPTQAVTITITVY